MYGENDMEKIFIMYEKSNFLVPQPRRREYGEAARTDRERGPRRVPEAREAGEAPQTPPKATF